MKALSCIEKRHEKWRETVAIISGFMGDVRLLRQDHVSEEDCEI